MTTKNVASEKLRCIECARTAIPNEKSIEQQLEAVRATISALGGVVVGHCIEAGVSGALYESRAELQKALTQIEQGQADALVWYDLSRMSRNVANFYNLKNRVDAAGGQIILCSGSLP